MGVDTWSKEGQARYKRKQAMDPNPDATTGFRYHKGDKPASRKVLLDRLNQARKDVLRELDWYETSRGREAKRNPPKPGRPYVTFDSWIVSHHKRSWAYYLKRYEKALNACLEAGIDIKS